jgi:uncharacterized membrane protein YfcA
MIAEPAFYAAAVPAVILVGLAKGGFSGLGILSLPLMALVISPVQAAAIMLPILMVQDAVSVHAFRGTVDTRMVRRLLPPAVIGIALGYGLAAFVSDAAVKLAVGAIAMGFGARRLVLERGGPLAATRPGRLAGWFWGSVIGFTSMIAHAGGPPFQVYALPQRLPRDVFVGTGAVMFALVNWLKVPPYLMLGEMTAENLATAGALLPLAVLSTWAGVRLVRMVPVERFFPMIHGLLILVGAKLVWDGVRGLL